MQYVIGQGARRYGIVNDKRNYDGQNNNQSD